MTPQELALSNLVWALLYVFFYFWLRKPVTHFFEATHPIRLLYHIILPMLLGCNLGYTLINYLSHTSLKPLIP